MTFDEFVERTDRFTRELTREEKSALKRFLGSEAVLVALANVALERSHEANVLIGTDLTSFSSDMALYTVAKSQGYALGIHKALGILFELAEIDEEAEEEGEDDA